MKTALTRRFTPVEVVYHAVQLILYLVLFISGGALIVSRIFELEGFRGATVSNIHRISGLALVGFLLQTIIISAFSKNFRPLWSTLLESFKWHMDDLVWLARMPVNILNPKVRLPLSGRFNSGQKLHILVVFCELATFSISGLVIIFLPGVIGAWTVHAVCFIPAMLFLGIHMFLSLLNPATRKALGGMVTGYVTQAYIQEHHPLMNGKCDSGSSHNKHISLLAVISTTGGMILVIISALWFVGFGRVTSQVVKVVKNSGREAIMPGALVSAHAEEPKTKECSSCHDYLNKPSDAKCLECHKNIRAVIDNNTGYHGTFRKGCNSCHGEHNGLEADIRPLNVKSFNHAISRYPLHGKHQELDCVKCHERVNEKTGRIRLKYTGLEFKACADCHNNPHPNFRDRDSCLACHTMQGWSKKELIFNHNRDSKYKLKGAHSAIECGKCHELSKDEQGATQVLLINMGVNCVDCHKDPHNKQFENGCKDCHIENGWKAPWLAEFHGPGSSYPLKGAHKDVKCAECHKAPDKSPKSNTVQFAGISSECANCHEDRHKGQIEKKCNVCHTENGWKAGDLLFVHNEHSSYKLDGLHTTVSCSLCHRSNIDNVVQYRPLSGKCAQCHNDIADNINGKSTIGAYKADPHANRVTCEDCHAVNKTKQLSYDYAKKCASCHNHHYYDLYFDWEKSMAIGIKNYLKRIDSLDDTSKKEELNKKLKLIKTIGFHNIQMTRELFDNLK